jgi:hypothetical protein
MAMLLSACVTKPNIERDNERSVLGAYRTCVEQRVETRLSVPSSASQRERPEAFVKCILYQPRVRSYCRVIFNKLHRGVQALRCILLSDDPFS